MEDKLQLGVRQGLEMLRNAGDRNTVVFLLQWRLFTGIHVWMLTGDKLETATCIVKSCRLVSRTQDIHVFKVSRDICVQHLTHSTCPGSEQQGEAHQELNAFRRKQDTALVIRVDSVEVCLQYYEHELMELLASAPAVVCCRNSLTPK